MFTGRLPLTYTELVCSPLAAFVFAISFASFLNQSACESQLLNSVISSCKSVGNGRMEIATSCHHPLINLFETAGVFYILLLLLLLLLSTEMGSCIFWRNTTLNAV